MGGFTESGRGCEPLAGPKKRLALSIELALCTGGLRVVQGHASSMWDGFGDVKWVGAGTWIGVSYFGLGNVTFCDFKFSKIFSLDKRTVVT